MHCLEEVGTQGVGDSRKHGQQQQDQSSTPPNLVNIRQCLAPYRPIFATDHCSACRRFCGSCLSRCMRFLNSKTFYIRCVLFATALHVLYFDVTRYPPHNLWVYMFFLTHWGHCINIMYLGCSLLCSIVYTSNDDNFDSSADGADDDRHDGITNNSEYDDGSGRNLPRLIKATWSLYGTAAPLSIAIALLYWASIAPGAHFPDVFTYPSVMEHGVVGLLVLFDGNIVGTVPVRAKHIVYMMIVCTSYLLWSLINWMQNLGNGEWGPAYDDDALYPVLKWGSETRLAATISGFAIVVLCPAVFWMVWMLSLASIEDVVHDDTKDESSGCSRCCGRCCCCCCWLRCCSKQVIWEGRRRPLLYNTQTKSTVTGADGYDDGHGAIYKEMTMGRLA